MPKPNLRAKLEAGEFVTAPGIHDMIAATMANKVGFDFVYSSGYWSTASAYGLPDAGIATSSQFLERIEILARTSNASIIADADTGFGGLLNVHHTVKSFEEAGVCAIQIEDQEFPKKCGHTPNKRVVSKEEMVDRVAVAVDARQSPDTLIIARTDARQPESYSEAIDRAAAYGEAGADILFVEALLSEQEMRDACAALDKPMIANMADGGKTPILPASQLQDIGYSMAIFPALTGLAAAAAIERGLEILKATGTSISDDNPMFNFNEFSSLIGFEDVWAFERKWAK